MANRIIAIVDLNDYHKQNVEVLLFANILEKKYKNLNVIDLNPYGHERLLPKKDFWKRSNEILNTKLFNNTSYQIIEGVSNQQKLINSLKTNKNNDLTIINTNKQSNKANVEFYKDIDEIVIFADLEDNINNNLIRFFLNNDLKGKKINLMIHNYRLNIQNKKIYLQLLKQFHQPNINITNIDTIPSFKTLSEIENIDPWLQIYKKINGEF